MMDITAETQGFAQTIKVLGSCNKELKKAAIEEMRAAADPLIAVAKARIPNDQPLSNWSPNGRWGFRPAAVRHSIRANFKKRRTDTEDTFTILRVVMTSFSGTVWDMAGGGSKIGRNLTSKWGAAPSRSMWPAAIASKAQVEAAVKRAADKAAQTLSDQLKVVRG